MKWILGAIALLSLIACSKEDSKQKEIATAHREIDEFHQQKLNMNIATSPSLLQAVTPSSKYDDSFLKNFCTLSAKQLTGTDLAPYTADPRLNNYLAAIVNNRNIPYTDCALKGKVLYDYPVEIAEYTVKGASLYVEVIYNENFKLGMVSTYATQKPIQISQTPMKTRDGVNLTTYAISPADSTPRGTILMRSPYMLMGGNLMYLRMAEAWNKNLVLQANRGTYNSEGDFQWISPIEMNDGEDAVNWITQQAFSNGKVVAFGVSYPGTDALAAAGNNPKGLVGVIACSAPANAATDSFTSGKFVELSLLGYVTAQNSANFPMAATASSAASNFHTTVFKDVRSTLDDALFGKNVPEWDASSLAIDDQNDKYWEERSLYKALEKATIPILHVSGLRGDQDGRDTLLAYRHLAQNAQHKENHFLATHADGHGCGDTFGLPIFQKIMALAGDTPVDLTTEARIHRVHATSKNYVTAAEESLLPIVNKTISLAQDAAFFDAAYEVFSPTPGRKIEDFAGVFVMPIDEDVILNGAPQLKLNYTVSNPETSLHLMILVYDAAGKVIAQNPVDRTNIITHKVNAVEEQTVTFPQMLVALPKGSQVVIYALSFNQNTFTRYPTSRPSTAGAAATVPQIQIHGVQSQLVLPVETSALVSPLAI